MNKENEIKFEDVKVYLGFCVYGDGYEADGEDVYLKVDCNEDIVKYMEAYMQKNWEELFADKVSRPEDISYATLEGFRIAAKGEEGHKLWAGLLGTKPYASVKLDIDKLEETNANKLRLPVPKPILSPNPA